MKTVAEKLQAARERMAAREPKAKVSAPTCNPVSSGRLCIRCEAQATLTDKANNRWCKACEMRYTLANWAHAHQYVKLECWPYAIAEGYVQWMNALLVGKDEYIADAYAAMSKSEVA